MKMVAKKLMKRKKPHWNNGYSMYDFKGEYLNVYGSTCHNFDPFDGIVFGQFECPMEGFGRDDTECCGIKKHEFCCTQMEKNYDLYTRTNNRRYYNSAKR